MLTGQHKSFYHLILTRRWLSSNSGVQRQLCMVFWSHRGQTLASGTHRGSIPHWRGHRQWLLILTLLCIYWTPKTFGTAEVLGRWQEENDKTSDLAKNEYIDQVNPEHWLSCKPLLLERGLPSGSLTPCLAYNHTFYVLVCRPPFMELLNGVWEQL